MSICICYTKRKFGANVVLDSHWSQIWQSFTNCALSSQLLTMFSCDKHFFSVILFRNQFFAFCAFFRARISTAPADSALSRTWLQDARLTGECFDCALRSGVAARASAHYYGQMCMCPACVLTHIVLPSWQGVHAQRTPSISCSVRPTWDSTNWSVPATGRPKSPATPPRCVLNKWEEKKGRPVCSNEWESARQRLLSTPRRPTSHKAVPCSSGPQVCQ